MATTRTVFSDQGPDDSDTLVRCSFFPSLFEAPVDDRYHQSINHPEYPLDDSDVVLEVFLPITGTHRFRNITSFLILFVPYIDVAQNTMLWHRECRDCHRIHGLDTRAAFVADLYALNIRPHSFIQDMRREYPFLIHSFRYEGVDTMP